ncbi:diaminopimelate epimerase [Alicyclobacillus sp. TC]|uniref:Diaminopimelate epimerase n=2 Tax=Alicyclobacillus tolerans TaxID=90970 RepID=A0ABT9LVI0_9BACL|nr:MULTISPECIES: diaminopimelate epimerase [Alicyclobacillus]MDP9728254.1 diaminopimelate epimerase [Alicyclobacillus tengchongensis]QRF23465.1 diaminopimelate epimerase [Alicyclobacillus sp. TC]SHJ81172.1 diaminopimelate epimerase [Alicyclobacillus montanus]
MKVTKMHALGNNYIYISEFEEKLTNYQLSDLAVQLSDVRKGIGSDGMILIGPSQRADIRMRIFNADGSEAENCGNGLRCVAKYAYEHGYVHGQTNFQIETKAGIVDATVYPDAKGYVPSVTVDMGTVQFGPEAVGFRGEADRAGRASIEVNGDIYSGYLVSVGNPHFVQFVENAKEYPVEEIGPKIEHHPSFIHRTNVEFVTPKTPYELDFRVWERGSGITFACGTGACASVAAGVAAGLLAEQVTVHLLGGDLRIEIRNGRVLMTGEAVEVFTGEVHI